MIVKISVALVGLVVLGLSVASARADVLNDELARLLASHPQILARKAEVAARAVVEEAIKDPSNAFMQRKVPFSWLELKDHMMVEAERQGGLKRTTRAQLLKWAIEGRFGSVGNASVEEQVDGFLQLMHG